jgi:hypothetical protein
MLNVLYEFHRLVDSCKAVINLLSVFNPKLDRSDMATVYSVPIVNRLRKLPQLGVGSGRRTGVVQWRREGLSEMFIIVVMLVEILVCVVNEKQAAHYDPYHKWSLLLKVLKVSRLGLNVHVFRLKILFMSHVFSQILVGRLIIIPRGS